MSVRVADEADDPEVQFLYTRPASSESMKCDVCAKDIHSMTVKQRANHYESHFSDAPNGESSSSKLTSNDSKLNLKSKFFHNNPLKRKRPGSDDQDAFWHPSLSTPPPANFTPGLVPILKKALMKSHAKGHTQKAYLCCDRAVYVSSQGWDRGWGCGYRNFEMSCAALMGDPRQEMYFPLLDARPPPSVRGVQKWLESAWEEGYDKEGAQHFKHHLAGSTKWIGTADLWVAYTARGIPSALVDFGDHNHRAGEVLVEWIVDHFAQNQPKQGQVTINDALKGAEPVVITQRLPIILQHSGHSRTVVGYEKTSGGAINLLIFDPSKTVPSNLRELALGLRRGEEGLHSRNGFSSPFKSLKQSLNGSAQKQPRKDEPEIIVIDDDTETPASPQFVSSSISDGDAVEMLKIVRVAASKLTRKDKYQVLYFPLTAPLTDAEKRARREVTSFKAC